MSGLRHRRELLGLSLKEASRRTGIPVDLLAALEAQEDDTGEVSGAAAKAKQQYQGFLTALVLRPPSHSIGEQTDTTGIMGPVRAGTIGPGKALAGGAALTLLVVLFLKLLSALVGGEPEVTAAATGLSLAMPTQEVTVRALEPTRLRVVVDGEVRHDGVLAPKNTLAFEGHERIEVDVTDLTRVRVRHDGSTVRPLGNLSAGRRLVFINDQGQ